MASRAVPNTCKIYCAIFHHAHHRTIASCTKRENQSFAAPEALYLDLWHTSNPDHTGKPPPLPSHISCAHFDHYSASPSPKKVAALVIFLASQFTGMTRSVGPRNKRRLTFWSRGRPTEPSTHDRLHEPPQHSLYLPNKGASKYTRDTHSHILPLPTRSNNQHGSQSLKLSSQCFSMSQLLHSMHPRQERTKQAWTWRAAWWKLASSLCALCPGVDNNRQNCVNIHSLNMCD